MISCKLAELYVICASSLSLLPQQFTPYAPQSSALSQQKMSSSNNMSATLETDSQPAINIFKQSILSTPPQSPALAVLITRNFLMKEHIQNLHMMAQESQTLPNNQPDIQSFPVVDILTIRSNTSLSNDERGPYTDNPHAFPGVLPVDAAHGPSSIPHALTMSGAVVTDSNADNSDS